MATTYKTTQGDTWDIIAKNAYGNELLMNVLIAANIEHRKTVIFPAGIELTIPDVSDAEVEASNLPIWKRS